MHHSTYPYPPKFRPMLAAKATTSQRFPCYVSPKYDGIRCLVYNGYVRTRAMKPLPNVATRDYLTWFSHLYPELMFDGELILKNSLKFGDITSAFMTERGSPDFKYVVFDTVKENQFNEPYCIRMDHMPNIIRASMPNIVFTSTRIAKNQDELTEAIESLLVDGYEGACTRLPSSIYKFGRSTANEQHLLKYKPFKDSEAIVVGVVEQMHNTNVTQVNELSLSSRSKHQDNLVPAGILGALVVKDDKVFPKIVFNIGTGFSMEERIRLWNNNPIGKTVKYKYQDYNLKVAPRSPVFLGFRDTRDL